MSPAAFCCLTETRIWHLEYHFKRDEVLAWHTMLLRLASSTDIRRIWVSDIYKRNRTGQSNFIQCLEILYFGCVSNDHWLFCCQNVFWGTEINCFYRMLGNFKIYCILMSKPSEIKWFGLQRWASPAFPGLPPDFAIEGPQTKEIWIELFPPVWTTKSQKTNEKINQIISINSDPKW